MDGLRALVASRLRDSIGGKEIDTSRNHVALPHMLGVVPLGQPVTVDAQRGTIFDPEHEFWSEYSEPVDTMGKASREIEAAIRSLQEDGIVEIEDVSDEVRIPRVYGPTYSERTECAECSADAVAEFDVSMESGTYFWDISVDCTSCGFTATFGRPMVRR